jgi:hypothetical protein
MAIDIEINGKPVVITTSASLSPNPEMLRRFTMVSLDETVDQTKAILKRQAAYAKLGISVDYDEKFIEAQKYLKRVKVAIPFADCLVNIFPTSHLLIRTHFNRFLDLIKASAAFHQYQRKTNENGFLIAESQDYDIARIALLKTTKNQKMIPITRNQERLLTDIKTHYDIDDFLIEDIASKVTYISDRWLRAELDKLADLGFLQKMKIEKTVDYRKGSGEPINKEYIGYKLIVFSINKVPFWSDLCRDYPDICSFTSIASTSSTTTNSSISSIGDGIDVIEPIEVIVRGIGTAQKRFSPRVCCGKIMSENRPGKYYCNECGAVQDVGD